MHSNDDYGDDLFGIPDPGASSYATDPTMLPAHFHFSNHGQDPSLHLPTPHSPNFLADSGVSHFLPYATPSRSMPSSEGQSSANPNLLQQSSAEVSYSFDSVVSTGGVALMLSTPQSSRNRQVATPESSPSYQDLMTEQPIAGLSLVTPAPLAPAPIISPPSDGRSTRALSEYSNILQGSPTPAGSAHSRKVSLKEYPEYMKRVKRSRASISSGVDDHSEDERTDRDVNTSGLGIIFSPVKGRRLKLYHPSEGGFPSQGTELPEPKTPTRDQSFTRLPESNGLSSGDSEMSEYRRAKLQRRLAAFLATPSHQVLLPVDIPGKGRVLVRPDDDDFAGMTSPTPIGPIGKRGGSKRIQKGKKRATAHKDDGRPFPFIYDVEALERKIALDISWPDAEFPWCLQTNERLELNERIKEEKLARIRRFLEPDTDGEEEDDRLSRSLIAGSSRISRTNSSPFNSAHREHRRRRQANGRKDRLVESADAKEVLIANRAAKVVAQDGSTHNPTGQYIIGSESDEDVLRCVCRGPDDGRAMVRCDQCNIWYHQECMGIKNEQELEEEWFCSICLEEAAAAAPPKPVVHEPTLVPTREEPPYRASSGQVPLYQLDESPGLRGPTTPRGPGRRLDFMLQTPMEGGSSQSQRSGTYFTQDSSRNASSPYRAWNKSEIKIWSTPSLFEDVAAAPDSPFDPTSTPSRGLKFGIPLISTATPKGFGTWSSRTGGLFATPIQHRLSTNQPIASTSKRILDFSDLTPGSSPWSVSPLAPAAGIYEENGNGKAQTYEFGGVLKLEAGFEESTAESSGGGVGGAESEGEQHHEGDTVIGVGISVLDESSANDGTPKP